MVENENKDLEGQESPESTPEASQESSVPSESAAPAASTEPEPTVDDDEEPKVTLRDHAIKWGVIIGLVGIIYTVLLYIVDAALLANMWLGLFTLVLFLGLVIYAGIDYRKQIGGLIPFGKAYQHGFLTLVIGGIIGTIFNYLLYNIIDPGLVETLAEAGAENARAIAERFGAPPEAIDDAVDKARTDTIDRLQGAGVFISFLWGLIAYAVIALITGVIVKKNPPESDVV
jgi:hypothetical protein